MTVTVLRVYGLPAPQGSKRAVPRKGGGVWMQDMGGDRLDDWRSAVATAAARHAGCWQYTGPTWLEIVFYTPMPASRPARVRSRGWALKTTTPDCDKLIRAVGDALTHSGLIVDDRILHTKEITRYETIGWTGAMIRLTPMDEDTPPPAWARNEGAPR